MNDINIGKIIAARRKGRGITQEELAVGMGISKASVSKWETGQSYPDIVLLPRLASFFHISIDELMGYKQYLSDEEIQEQFVAFSALLLNKDVEGALEECHKFLRGYGSCFPLLLRTAYFYIDCCYMLPEERQKQLLEETVKLCGRIVAECGDLSIRKQAIGLEAACRLLLGQPETVLELLGEEVQVLSEDENLIALAYQSLGEQTKAVKAVQVSIYQHMTATVDALISYLHLNAERPEVFEETWNRIQSLFKTFQMENLKPSAVLKTYVIAAAARCRNGEAAEALKLLQCYVEFYFSVPDASHLGGDGFFDQVEAWLGEMKLESMPMRSLRTIQTELMPILMEEPEFAILKDYPEFQEIVRRMRVRKE